MLRRGNEGQAALREAAGAELMVLAVGNEPDLWDWPEDWLARWAAGRKVAKARLALVLVRARPTVLSRRRASSVRSAASPSGRTCACWCSTKAGRTLTAGRVRLRLLLSQLSNQPRRVQRWTYCAQRVPSLRL